MSPSPDPLSPDAGEALRAWLGSETEVTAVTGTRIGISLTGSAPAIRYGLITGDNRVGAGVGMVRYQVECWGAGGGAPDDGTSLQLALKVMRLTPKFCGTFAGAKVAGASARYPSANPDTTSNRPRHIVEVSFIATP